MTARFVRRSVIALLPLAAGVLIAVLLWNVEDLDNPILYARADVGTVVLFVGAALSLLLGMGLLLWTLAERYRQEAADARAQAAEERRRFVQRLDHELKNPLTAIRAVPPKDYHPEPMVNLDEETYRDEKGHLYHVSSTTHDLMPYKRNVEAYVPPTLESLQEEIDRFEEEPVSHPADSEWESVRHAVTEMGDTHFVMLLCGDVAFPGFGATEEEFWMNLLLEPEICHKIAELQGKRLLRQIPLFAQLGVDGIMPCGDLGNSTGMLASPQICRDIVYPWNKAMADEAHRHGLKILKHCCGHTWPVIEELAEIYDAYEGIQASAGMDIRRLKERVGDRLCLWGGIWHEHIILGSPQDIRDDARYAFEYAAPGGGYMMGSTHSLAVDARVENILEMERCRDEWGIYPIDPSRFQE